MPTNTASALTARSGNRQSRAQRALSFAYTQLPLYSGMVSTLRNAIVGAALALCAAGTAGAEVYDFNTFLSGGGGGQDPAKQRIARARGADICVDIREGRTASTNRVLFTFWSQIPERNSRIMSIAFDLGRHSDLFANMSVLVSSPGLKPQISPGRAHAFLPRFSPKYVVGFAPRNGMAPGNTLVVAATLANGKTYANVRSALSEGLNPATASTGLRVGVIALSLLGGPPPGVATIQDDGGFSMTSVSSRCRSR